MKVEIGFLVLLDASLAPGSARNALSQDTRQRAIKQDFRCPLLASALILMCLYTCTYATHILIHGHTCAHEHAHTPHISLFTGTHVLMNVRTQHTYPSPFSLPCVQVCAGTQTHTHTKKITMTKKEKSCGLQNIDSISHLVLCEGC